MELNSNCTYPRRNVEARRQTLYAKLIFDTFDLATLTFAFRPRNITVFVALRLQLSGAAFILLSVQLQSDVDGDRNLLLRAAH